MSISHAYSGVWKGESDREKHHLHHLSSAINDDDKESSYFLKVCKASSLQNPVCSQRCPSKIDSVSPTECSSVISKWGREGNGLLWWRIWKPVLLTLQSSLFSPIPYSDVKAAWTDLAASPSQRNLPRCNFILIVDQREGGEVAEDFLAFIKIDQRLACLRCEIGG